jgi:hypothetical protein
VDVIGWIEIVGERTHRRFDIAMRQRGFGLVRAHRRRADAEIGEADVIETLAVDPRAGRKSYHGVVAVAARELGEADAGVRGRGGNANGREHVLRAERGLE